MDGLGMMTGDIGQYWGSSVLPPHFIGQYFTRIYRICVYDNILLLRFLILTNACFCSSIFQKTCSSPKQEKVITKTTFIMILPQFRN